MKLTDYTLIGISGKQYAGKDLLTSMLLDYLPADFRRIPLAYAIKQLYAERTGLTLEEIEQNKAIYRPDLIALGDWGRAQDPDYWLKKVINLPGPKIISDVRLLREYHYLRQLTPPCLLIRLEATREIRAGRGKLVSESDPTECELDQITDWDIVFENNDSPEVLRELIKGYLMLEFH